MLSKEKYLLGLYNHGDIKFKLNLQELIQHKTNSKDLFCFLKPNENIIKIIQKSIPLHKNIKTINVQHE